MITIGYNQVQEKHVADTNSTRREDAHEAKKVYVGNKLAHVHVNDNTEFALRQTLNGYIHEDNDLYAKVRSIRGNTKVWNQLMNNTAAPFVFTKPNSRTALLPVAVTSAHKYLIVLDCKDCVPSTTTTNIFGLESSAGNQIYFDISDGRKLKIATASASKDSIYAFISTQCSDGTSMTISYAMFIDLTLIYGAGNEPTTVAEFEADFQQWFGRPIGAEPYDAGSLIPFVGTGLKSTGFNLWDEEWEEGIINGNGIPESGTNYIRSKNFINIIRGVDYYFARHDSVDLYGLRVAFYNANKNYLSQVYCNRSIISSPNDAVYCKIFTSQVYGTTYNHDICINLSNPTLNGTYVPYKATTLPIPVTTLTGKAEGSTTSEVIFPYGMKSAGSVKDEVYVEDGKTYAVKRVGSVDLGTLTWTKGTYAFYNVKGEINNAQNDNIICAVYKTGPYGAAGQIMADKSISAEELFDLYIKDTSYTDATTFKAAMSGVMLYYELATPIVYEVDNYTLPLYYPANGTGTEEIVSTATSAPADMDIEYRLRQRVRLVDMGTPGVLWADSDIDITKPDGFCDNPYTYEKSFFSWGNVVGHNPISNTAFDYDWGGVNQAEPWYDGQPYGSTPGSTLTGNIPADAQYDAAKAVLGGNWRMPSNAEYSALFRICKFLEADGSDMDTSKTDKRVDMPDGNGGTVKGIYIESTVTGNRLFFSCSGRGNGRSWSNRGSLGLYWSSTWNSARNAQLLGFSSDGVSAQNNNSGRYYGFALRPVYPISQ